MPRRRRPTISLVPSDWAYSVAHRRALNGSTTGDLWDILLGKDDEPAPDGGGILTGDAPPKSLDPGPVPFRAGHWRHEPSPPLYVLAQGDTLYGLGKTYAGDGQAWLTQLRPLQTRSESEPSPISGGRYVNKDSTKFYPTSTAPGRFIQPGDVLIMPRAWSDRAKALEGRGDSSPSQPGTPGWREETEGGSGTSWLDGKTLGISNKWLLAGGAVAALYALT